MHQVSQAMEKVQRRAAALQNSKRRARINRERRKERRLVVAGKEDNAGVSREDESLFNRLRQARYYLFEVI